jgi:dihydropteroate synthase
MYMNYKKTVGKTGRSARSHFSGVGLVGPDPEKCEPKRSPVLPTTLAGGGAPEGEPTVPSRDFLMNILQKKLGKKPLIMGILNVTPDSFSDGGEFVGVNKAVDRALQMEEEGADIIDIGGESTGPDSKHVSAHEEIKRVIPVFEKLRNKTKIFLSIDTYKHSTALHALNVGANMVNDVTAFRGSEKMAESLANYDVPIVIMYSKDKTPRTTKKVVEYDNVVKTIKKFLKERIEYGVNAGIKRKRFIIDPGMGMFVGGDPKYSMQILRRLKEFDDFGLPVLVGPSRKSFIGGNIKERLEGGLAAAAIAVYNSASIIRTHDVKETRKVVDMAYTIRDSLQDC